MMVLVWVDITFGVLDFAFEGWVSRGCGFYCGGMGGVLDY